MSGAEKRFMEMTRSATLVAERTSIHARGSVHADVRRELQRLILFVP